MMISAVEFPVRLPPGEYKAITAAMVTRYHGTGESNRAVEFVRFATNQSFAVGVGVNGFWSGLEPNGDFCSPAESVVEMNRSEKNNQ